MSKFFIGGYHKVSINQIEANEDIVGLIIPQLLYKGPYNNEELSQKIKDEQPIRLIADTFTINKSFFNNEEGKQKRAGKFTNKYFSLDKTLNYFLIRIKVLRDTPEYKKLGKIPNFGRLLGGSLSNKSHLLSTETKYVSGDATFGNNLPPKFDIYTIKNLNGKGFINVIQDVRLKLEQSYNVTSKNNAGVSDSIVLKSTRFYLSDNRTGVKFDEVDNKLRAFSIKSADRSRFSSTPFNLTQDEGDKNSFLAINTRDIDNIYNVINNIGKIPTLYTDQDRSGLKRLNEKVFNLMNVSQYTNILSDSYFVPSQSFTIDYINLLLYMAIEQSLGIDIVKDFFLRNPYIVLEHLLNKVFYAIRNKDDSFSSENILVHPNINYLAFRRADSNAIQANLNTMIKNNFDKSRLIYDKYQNNKATVPETTYVKEVYNALAADPGLNQILKFMYSIATYVKILDTTIVNIIGEEIKLKRRGIFT